MSKMPDTSNEGLVKKKVKKLLDDHEWFWWMTPANGFGKSGVSDICAVKWGIFIAIETKYGTNMPTPQQRAFLRSIASCEHFAVVVSDKTLAVFGDFLTKLDHSVKITQQGLEVPADLVNALSEALIVLTNPWSMS